MNFNSLKQNDQVYWKNLLVTFQNLTTIISGIQFCIVQDQRGCNFEVAVQELYRIFKEIV